MNHDPRLVAWERHVQLHRGKTQQGQEEARNATEPPFGSQNGPPANDFRSRARTEDGGHAGEPGFEPGEHGANWTKRGTRKQTSDLGWQESSPQRGERQRTGNGEIRLRLATTVSTPPGKPIHNTSTQERSQWRSVHTDRQVMAPPRAAAGAGTSTPGLTEETAQGAQGFQNTTTTRVAVIGYITRRHPLPPAAVGRGNNGERSSSNKADACQQDTRATGREAKAYSPGTRVQEQREISLTSGGCPRSRSSDEIGPSRRGKKTTIQKVAW